MIYLDAEEKVIDKDWVEKKVEDWKKECMNCMLPFSSGWRAVRVILSRAGKRCFIHVGFDYYTIPKMVCTKKLTTD